MKKLFVLLGAFFLFLLPFRAASQDEFKEWKNADTAAVQKEGSVTGAPATPPPTASFKGEESGSHHQNLRWLAAALFATIIAGVFVRFKILRRSRPFFLLSSVAILGFYHGSCPCPVGGFQEAALFLFGKNGHLPWIWWFAALLPVTYVFGRVWCGWVCQLGALQEMVHLGSRWHFLSSRRSQAVLRTIRTVAFFALLGQLFISGTRWWKDIDPFKAAFNLVATDGLSWVLLGLLLISSVLSFRPFCRTLCPVGFVLGWIARLPGAAVLQAHTGCIGCKVCSKACKNGALHFDNKTVTLLKQECIGCGDCMDACPLQGIRYQNKPTSFEGKVIFSTKKELAS